MCIQFHADESICQENQDSYPKRDEDLPLRSETGIPPGELRIERKIRREAEKKRDEYSSVNEYCTCGCKQGRIDKFIFSDMLQIMLEPVDICHMQRSYRVIQQSANAISFQ
jgi:hypothetical protein